MLVHGLLLNRRSEKTATGGGGDFSVLHCAGVIANGVNAFYVRVLPFINDDVTFSLVFTPAATRLILSIGVRFATNSPDQAINGFTAAIFQFQSQTAVGVFHYRFRHGGGMRLRALAFITSTSVSLIIGSKRSGACLRTNRCVFAPAR